MKRLFVFFVALFLVFGVYAAQQLDSPTINVKPLLNNDTAVEVENPFAGIWGFYLKIIIGFIGGSLMVVRFATEISAAVIYEGEESTGKIRQAIIRFLVHVGIASIGFILISLLA